MKITTSITSYCGPPRRELDRVAGRGLGVVLDSGRLVGDWWLAMADSTVSSDGALDWDSMTGEGLWAEIEGGGFGLVRGVSFQRVTLAQVPCT